MTRKIFFTWALGILILTSGQGALWAQDADTAPHGGTLVGLGAHHVAHVEFLLNPKSGELKAYILDEQCKTPLLLVQDQIDLTVVLPSGKKFDIGLRGTARSKQDNYEEYLGQSESLKGITKFRGILQSLFVMDQEFNQFGFDFPEGSG